MMEWGKMLQMMLILRLFEPTVGTNMHLLSSTNS